MSRKTTADENSGATEDERTTAFSETRGVTRRRALALAGTGLVSGVIGTALGDTHDAVVYNSAGQFVAENGGTAVYSGSDYINAIQAAVDSLTDGRTTKEKVRVDATGSTGSASSAKAVDLPSYTVLDVPGSIDVNDTGEPWVVPARARNAEHVEIQRFNVTGNPRYGIRMSHCDDVIIDDVTMDLSAGLGIRIDGRDGADTTNVTLNSADISGASTHAVETYGVDGIDIGTVTATDIDQGCGLLLNDTANATVDFVDATRCDQGGGYAGFRCANDAGPNITVNGVNATDCGRGIFTVSGSSGIEIHDVALDGNGGNLVQDTRDTLIDGGTITDTGSAGIRLDSRDDNTHPHTRNITVQNLTIENSAGYGVYETGPDTENNTVQYNSFCTNDSGAVEVYASSTTVSDNTYCDGDSGDGPISTGTYRITNINSGKLLEVADADTSDGATVQQYADTGHATQEWYVEDTGDGVYRFENQNSGKVMDVEGGSTDDGANVLQWSDGGADNQRWYIVDQGGGEYTIEAAHSGKVADVYGASADDGANVIQWSDTGGSNQRWTFESV